MVLFCNTLSPDECIADVVTRAIEGMGYRKGKLAEFHGTSIGHPTKSIN